MKRIYSQFRIGLMTFALGLAAVYFINGLLIAWSEVAVELPSAESASVLTVFPLQFVLTREMNCGKDPRDARARMECTNEKLFGNRDMSLYSRYQITQCPYEPEGYVDDCLTRKESEQVQRQLIWKHWRDKTRAQLALKYVDSSLEEHYFIEPEDNVHWHLAVASVRFWILSVRGEPTTVGIVDTPSTYRRARWKIATEEDRIYDLIPRGTRFLQFANENDDTFSF